MNFGFVVLIRAYCRKGIADAFQFIGRGLSEINWALIHNTINFKKNKSQNKQSQIQNFSTREKENQIDRRKFSQAFKDALGNDIFRICCHGA